ncbi:hypothetical protein NDU88_000253 [Pleurodeles waltl]|uniref:Uncharacterized protein n=1 Tax=Pleurodeles waltl TaxID=8319 RepID=A0AAV7S930_PLEWA|nr:hypothetical protein NDU88_000253 [Pleurodeles waltl]
MRSAHTGRELERRLWSSHFWHSFPFASWHPGGSKKKINNRAIVHRLRALSGLTLRARNSGGGDIVL